jgi:hypothetical protein
MTSEARPRHRSRWATLIAPVSASSATKRRRDGGTKLLRSKALNCGEAFDLVVGNKY